MADVLDGLTPRTASIPLYSTVTGTRIDGRELDASYWWRNVREPVFFAAATDCLIRDGFATFVELSPHPVLASSIGECLLGAGRQGTVVPSLRRGEEERAILLGSLGSLYTLGYPVRWSTLYPGSQPPVRLPTYQWQRERHWHESDESRLARLGHQDHPLLGRRVPSPQPTWRLDLNQRRLPYLRDHQIQGAVLLPGAAYVEMALAAASQVYGEGAYVLEDIQFRKALFMSASDEPALQLTLDPRQAAFEIYSQSKGTKDSWTLHASVQLRHG
jgi:acyl transferase domain-containing protein